MNTIENVSQVLSISDIVSIIATILTFIGILVSLIISILTLKQNNKFKREEARAMIVCYIEHITKTENSYIIIQNLGNSIGRILEISITPEINLHKILGITSNTFISIFERTNYILAPNQKLSSWYNFIKHKIPEFSVTIKYETLGKEYIEKFELNPGIAHSVVHTEKTLSNLSAEGNVLNQINISMKEISEKL